MSNGQKHEDWLKRSGRSLRREEGDREDGVGRLAVALARM